MKTAKITTKLPDSQDLAEIYQSMTVKQALLRGADGVYERITPYVLCRDFLVDVYSFSNAKKDFGIYGMAFNGSKEQPEHHHLPILLRFPSKQTKEIFLNHILLLRDLEDHNRWGWTDLYQVNDLEIIAEGSAEWLSSCLLVSLYTFLLRALCYDFETKASDGWKWILAFGNLKGTDPRYAASIAAPTWERIFADLAILRMKDFCGFDTNKEEIRTVHHNSGFISVFGYHTELSQAAVHRNAHWKHMQKQGIRTYTK